MKKKKDRRNLLADKRVAGLLAILLGVLCWVIVAGFLNNNQEKTLFNVPIDYAKRAEDYERHDLQIVTDMQNLTFAEVKVNGDASLISGFSNTDVTVYPDYSNVNGPGTFVVPLKAEKVTAGSYNIVEYSLANSEHSLRKQPTTTVTLAFEEVQTKTFPVQVQADNVTAASGYFRDTPVPSQTEVTVTGPSSEVAKVNAVVANVAQDEERSESIIYTVPLEMVDKEGNVIESDLLTINPVQTVEVEIPILEMRTLDLTVELIGAQQGLDTEWLLDRLVLSSKSIQVVGSAENLAALQNPYPVAQIDVSELDIGWESEEISIVLPEGLRSQDSAKEVTVSFDSTGLVKKSFEVTNISVRNTPRGAKITPQPTSVTVNLIGPSEQIDTLLPGNISILVDAFGISAAKSGQQTLPGRVAIPSADKVFATGSYPIICNIEVS